MSLRVPYKKVENAEQAYILVKSSLNSDLVAKYKVKANITSDDSRRVIYAKGKGFALEASFEESEVEIEIKLSFLLKGLKNRITSTIEKQFLEIL